MAEFNIFGSPSKDSVRVGYISTDRGYIESITICEANKYAQKNPGTQFIFKTRNFVKYLNINEVNKLTPNDALVDEKTCEGVVIEKKCGPAEALFYGGGGVGVQGNPIIGSDGAVLAVDLVAGGFGYQYPPIVEIKDSCGIGAGAVVTAVLGEIVETEEVYDQEGDFEDYKFDLCPPESAGYGLRYGPSGEVLGKWDPTLYANLSKDPIRKEIKEYQDFLQQLQKPWWTTRKEPPLKVTSANRTSRVKHDVTYPIWSEFLNKYAISPVPPSNAPGSDFAGIPFTLEWEEEFPYEGEYVFRGLADNGGTLYLDNLKLADLQSVTFIDQSNPQDSALSVKDAPNTIKKTITAGVHRIRIDLYNEPLYETIITPPKTEEQPAGILFIKEGNQYFMLAGGNDIIEVDFIFEWFDDENFGYAVTRITLPTESGPLFFSRPTSGSTGQGKLTGTFKANQKYGPITFEGTTPGSRVPEIKDLDRPQQKIIFWDNNPDDDIPNAELRSVIARQLSPPRVVQQPSTQTGTVQVRRVFNTVDYINRADRTLWRIDPRAGRDAGFINQFGILPFDPNSTEAQTESFAGTHTIRWDAVDFPVDGNYNIEIMVDDDVTLYIQNSTSGEEVIIKKAGFTNTGTSTGKSLETRFFKTGKYRIRAELTQINVGPLGKQNPMALAVNIEVSFTQSKIVSAKSWNENPIAAALTIDAPLPPIPQEPIPLQEGRCPRNPMWTTRFPNGSEKWWPVNYTNPKGPTWSAFTNRFAISPIPPLSTPGSDSGGIVYKNSWNLDIPYDGFYALKATVDDGGRILVDDKEIIRGGGVSFKTTTSSVQGIEPYNVESPKATKFFLTKGLHKIAVEVENQNTETFRKIDKKVFSTNDWLFGSKTEEQPAGILFIKEGNQYFMLTGGNDIIEVDFIFEWFDDPNFGYAVTRITLPTERGPLFFSRPTSGSTGTSGVLTGTFKANQKYGPIIFEGTTPGSRVPEIKDLDRPQQKIIFWDNNPDDDIPNAELRSVIARQLSPARTTIIKQSPTAVGVVYEGPTAIANYDRDFISPTFQNVNAVPNEEIQGRTWIFRWSNVDFPVNGQYTLEAGADDNLIVKVDGIQVGGAKVSEGRGKTKFNATAGKKTVELELSNIRIPNTGFSQNPVAAFAEITIPVDVATGLSKSWTQNPIGISAILIPPPCPRVIKGKGVVNRLNVNDPGNGYPQPIPPPTPTTTSTYPVALRLSSVPVLDTGINHNCGKDKIQITPSNGAILDYNCDSFGRIREVIIKDPGFGFTTYPDIRMVTDTGINATFAPQFEVIRDPIVIDPQKLIQVTDLAGLKQTGYVDGRPYYGAVFLKDGLLFAGFYETPGELVQVYATLKESIDAQVTTRPSAIQRQGTDITSNDPRLNIPGTPDQII